MKEVTKDFMALMGFIVGAILLLLTLSLFVGCAGVTPGQKILIDTIDGNAETLNNEVPAMLAPNIPDVERRMVVELLKDQRRAAADLKASAEDDGDE